MRETSAAFAEAVRACSQLVVVRAEVCVSDATVLELEIVTGQVVMDARRAVQRDASLSVSPMPGLLEALSIPGAEVRISRGLVVDGTPELVGLGVFEIDQYGVDILGTATLSLVDRAQRIARNVWATTWTIPAEMPVKAAVSGILVDRWPECPIGWSDTGAPIGLQTTLSLGGDPWADAVKLAASAGLLLFFDGDGVARLIEIVDPSALSPVETYRYGNGGMMLERTRQTTSSGLYNGVIVVSQNTSLATPVIGEAWDDDPASPYRRSGPLGPMPLVIQTQTVATVADAHALAVARLASVRGRAEQTTWSQIVDPRLEPLDLVCLVGADGTPEYHMADAITVPLISSGAMSVTAAGGGIASDDAHAVAETLRQALQTDPTATRLRQGTVTDTAADGTVSVLLPESPLPITGVSTLNGATVEDDSTVWVATQDGDMLVMGTTEPSDNGGGGTGSTGAWWVKSDHWINTASGALKVILDESGPSGEIDVIPDVSGVVRNWAYGYYGDMGNWPDPMSMQCDCIVIAVTTEGGGSGAVVTHVFNLPQSS